MGGRTGRSESTEHSHPARWCVRAEVVIGGPAPLLAALGQPSPRPAQRAAPAGGPRRAQASRQTGGGAEMTRECRTAHRSGPFLERDYVRPGPSGARPPAMPARGRRHALIVPVGSWLRKVTGGLEDRAFHAERPDGDTLRYPPVKARVEGQRLLHHVADRSQGDGLAPAQEVRHGLTLSQDHDLGKVTNVTCFRARERLHSGV